MLRLCHIVATSVRYEYQIKILNLPLSSCFKFTQNSLICFGSWMLYLTLLGTCVGSIEKKKKTKFTLLKSIYFHFKKLTKKILVFFWIKLGRSLIFQNLLQSESPTLHWLKESSFAGKRPIANVRFLWFLSKRYQKKKMCHIFKNKGNCPVVSCKLLKKTSAVDLVST